MSLFPIIMQLIAKLLFDFFVLIKPQSCLFYPKWIPISLIISHTTIIYQINHPLIVKILKMHSIVCIHLPQLTQTCDICLLHPMWSHLPVAFLKIHTFFMYPPPLTNPNMCV